LQPRPRRHRSALWRKAGVVKFRVDSLVGALGQPARGRSALWGGAWRRGALGEAPGGPSGWEIVRPDPRSRACARRRRGWLASPIDLTNARFGASYTQLRRLGSAAAFRMMEPTVFTRWSVACFCGNVYVAPPCRCSVCGRTFSSESMNELRLRASGTWQQRNSLPGRAIWVRQAINPLVPAEARRLRPPAR